MINTFFWIYIISFFTFVSAKTNYTKLPDTIKKDIRHKWDSCCKSNTCIRNSCFIVQWGASSWPAVRQRCQSQYPEWPYTVDIFRILNESDFRTFWTMLQETPLPRRKKQTTLWTSGSRCPKISSTERVFITRWISTEEEFPAWLDGKINSSRLPSTHSISCEFLAVSLAPNTADVKYDFQDQNAHHPAICEFRIPDGEWTSEHQSTPGTTKEQTTTITTETVEQDIIITLPPPATTERVVINVTDIKRPETSSPKAESAPSASSPSSTTSQETTTIPATSTIQPRYCKAEIGNGMFWPSTPAGVTLYLNCPQGMIGTAEWTCSNETLRFWPPGKPQTEGCKHEWIKHLEDAISERDDAVEVSTRLSKETKHNNMSHGDIIALVNLTGRLFRLYTEQKGEEEFEVSESEEAPIYYNFTKTMISSISNILRKEIKNAWKELNDTRQTKEASTILKLVTTIGSRLSCMRKSSEKLQFTVSEDNIALQTFIWNNTSENDDLVRFPEETKSVKANSFIALPANLKFEERSPCKNYRSAVGVIYKHVGDFLKVGHQENSTTRVATKVLSFSLSNSTESISLSEGKVNITLRQEKVNGKKPVNPRCVFWNFSKSDFGEWDESGCELLSSNDTHIMCQCDHLTNFAALFDFNDIIETNNVLKWMTYVCCGFSCVALLLTVSCFLVIRSLHGRRSIITGNLSFSLLVTNGLIIFGLDKTTNPTGCAIIAGFLHYWGLASFCWMLIEGYHLYRMVILVFQRGTNPSVKYYYLFAYGIPLIVVGVSAGIKTEGYGQEKHCWLSAKKEDGALIWSFIGPACFIILINVVIFILTLRSASSVKIKKEQSTMKKIKSWIRGSISVMCLLGLTWSIGFLYSDKQTEFFAYVFTILNGLQGVFIFLFHIILNDKVSSFFSCKETKKYGRKKFLNHTSSNPTNSKTSTRTSMNSLVCTSSTRLADTKNTSSNHSAEISRNTGVPNGKMETSDAGRTNFKKNRVTNKPSSNGLTQKTTPYDINVRFRSGSNSEPNGIHPRVSTKSILTSL